MSKKRALEQEAKQRELFAFVSDLLDKKKVEVTDHHATEKLKIPTHLKDITIHQLKEAGANLDLYGLTIPHATDDHFRRLFDVKGRLHELRENKIKEMKSYYNNMKNDIPRNLLNSKLGDLTDDEWLQIGFNTRKFTESARNPNDSRKRRN